MFQTISSLEITLSKSIKMIKNYLHNHFVEFLLFAFWRIELKIEDVKNHFIKSLTNHCTIYSFVLFWLLHYFVIIIQLRIVEFFANTEESYFCTFHTTIAQFRSFVILQKELR